MQGCRGIRRDERPWGGEDPPGAAYLFADGRGRKYAEKLMAGFTGILQTDGHSAYKSMAKNKAVKLVHCWAHARRKLTEVEATGKDPIAGKGLEMIAGLYEIERKVRGQGADKRRTARQKQSKPIVDEMEKWLAESRSLALPKSPLSKALEYIANHWDGLKIFLDDGRVEIDSNGMERSIRPLVMTRKNSLFAGSKGAAQHWAILASLTETCALNSVNPYEYLVWVFDALCKGHPQSRIDELLPWAYADMARSEQKPADQAA